MFLFSSGMFGLKTLSRTVSTLRLMFTATDIFFGCAHKFWDASKSVKSVKKLNDVADTFFFGGVLMAFL